MPQVRHNFYLSEFEVCRIVVRLRRTLQGGSTPDAHGDPSPKLGWTDVLRFLKGDVTIVIGDIVKKVIVNICISVLRMKRSSTYIVHVLQMKFDFLLGPTAVFS